MFVERVAAQESPDLTPPASREVALTEGRRLGSGRAGAYPSPVESVEPDAIATTPPEEFFAEVETDRLMSLSPEYLGILQRQLARFFTWRDLARHELVERLVGRRIVAAIPLNARGDGIRVALTAEDGSSLTVELRGR